MRPNIIFYFSDQQRWDTVNDVVMPNVTELSEDGVLFENSFTCQPVCGPARACLQTGQYATQNKCYWNGIALPEDTHSGTYYYDDFLCDLVNDPNEKQTLSATINTQIFLFRCVSFFQEKW